jgi:hypothetical protein
MPSQGVITIFWCSGYPFHNSTHLHSDRQLQDRPSTPLCIMKFWLSVPLDRSRFNARDEFSGFPVGVNLLIAFSSWKSRDVSNGIMFHVRAPWVPMETQRPSSTRAFESKVSTTCVSSMRASFPVSRDTSTSYRSLLRIGRHKRLWAPYSVCSRMRIQELFYGSSSCGTFRRCRRLHYSRVNGVSRLASKGRPGSTHQSATVLPHLLSSIRLFSSIRRDCSLRPCRFHIQCASSSLEGNNLSKPSAFPPGESSDAGMDLSRVCCEVTAAAPGVALATPRGNTR